MANSNICNADIEVKDIHCIGSRYMPTIDPFLNAVTLLVSAFIFGNNGSK